MWLETPTLCSFSNLLLLRSHCFSFPLVHYSHSMAAVYHDYKDEDMFLYITYSGENVFGAEDGSGAASE